MYSNVDDCEYVDLPNYYHKELAATVIHVRICTASFTLVAHNLSSRDLTPSNYVFKWSIYCESASMD